MYSQGLPDEVTVDISFVEIPLDSAFLLLSKESGINISYDTRVLPSSKLVSAAPNNLRLGLVLDDILFGTKLKYRIIGNQLIIVPDESLNKQKHITVSGIIKDGRTGERLEYASIYTGFGERGTASSEYGQYSFRIPVGRQLLHYSYLGYSEKAFDVDLYNDTTIHIDLFTNNQLNEIFVTEKVPERFKQTEQYDEVPVEMLNTTGGLLGEPDIFRMMHLRSGVVSGADGFGGLHVRGGSMDQNLILLDGVPVYNAGHALGLFSIFNPSAIKSAKLIKAGFPSRYGGRLSSVLDIRTKNGNNQFLQGDVSANPLMIRGSIEGPIKKGRSSFIVSGRRTIVDPWLQPLSKYQFSQKDEEGKVQFYFYDFNAKINSQIGDRDEVYLSIYAGQDQYENELTSFIRDGTNVSSEELELNAWSWGNSIGTVRWRHIFSRKIFSNLSVSYSDFNFENFDFDRSVVDPNGEPLTGYQARIFNSSIANFIVSLELDFFIAKGLSFKAGSHYTGHRISPGVSFSSTSDNLFHAVERVTPDDLKQGFTPPVLEGREIRLYSQAEWSPLTWLTANMGIHISSIQTDVKSYRSLQPRVNLQMNVAPAITAKLAYSEMDQYLHLLSSSGLGLPNDVWIPSTGEIAPQRSKQVALSISWRNNEYLSWRMGAYRKEYSNITGIAEGSIFDIREGIDWQSQVPVGTGEAYGWEIEIEKRVGGLKGWFNYSWSKSKRTFDDINNGQQYFARQDRRHAFNANVLVQFNKNLEFTSSWTWYSGSPFTVPTSIDPVPTQNGFELIPQYSSINNIRLPDYHKLDFSFNFYTNYGWGSQKLSVGAYNAYNRNNPFYIDVVRDPFHNNSFKLQSVHIVPLLPFVSFGLAF